MRILLTALFLTLAALGAARADDKGLAEPRPTIEQPRKIILTLSESDPARIDNVLNNIGNIQKFYGADYVRIALVAYGPGIETVLKESSKVRSRIEGLIAIEVEIEACGNTLDALHKGPGDLIPGVKLVPAGLPEVVERQLAGWVYIRP